MPHTRHMGSWSSSQYSFNLSSCSSHISTSMPRRGQCPMDEATLLMLDPGSRSSGSSSAYSGAHPLVPAARSMARALRTLSTTLHRSELGRSLRPLDFLHLGQLDNSSALASQHWMMHCWQKWCPHSRITGSENSSKHTGQPTASESGTQYKEEEKLADGVNQEEKLQAKGVRKLGTAAWLDMMNQLMRRPKYSRPAALLCMMSRKQMQCSTGALLLLLPWFGGLVLGEIGNDFSKCLDFFYKKTPPKGITAAGYQPICQRFKNRYHFASLYRREHRSPLYSAYILSPANGKRPASIWMFEPQLAFSRGEAEMQPFKRLVDQNVIESQAVLKDYRNSIFTRGHLNPSMHQKTNEDREATFTLTNIVPQMKGSNCGPWSDLEMEVLRNFTAFCKGLMHVITGVLPYESEPRWMNKRVSVPEYMWSAYCCPSYRSNLPMSVPFFPTYAAVGRNDPNSGDEIVPFTNGYDVRRMSLEALEGILNQRLAMRITLFHGQCH
ncbi:Endonuclease domain-containing 1 protein [Liparis tanakae]|uniref:Endonuclease domain-containing 1 protein n=1 Tax=Liparis tanakae TaxID=230148 RepID=A0A4Z2IIN7_9TELE|nr:Endonuclease domain-containing 1 protein [Liparis tanakae]